MKEERLRAVDPIELELRAASPLGPGPWLSTEGLPWVERLEAAAETIAAELASALSELEGAPPALQRVQPEQAMLTEDAGWTVLLLRGYGERFDRTCARFPRTLEALEAVPGVTTALFSALAPGKAIPLHSGPWAGVLRCHLPLVVPRRRERCWIEVGGERRSWERGRCVLFDDTWPHAVHNDTGERRVVLFLDVLRPLPPSLKAVNLERVEAIRRSPFVQEAAARYERWEREAWPE